MIVSFAYFIEIPIVVCVLKEIGSWFTGEDFVCIAEIFFMMLGLAYAAPFAYPIILIVVLPISFAIINAVYNVSDEQRLFGGGMWAGSSASYINSRRRK